MRIRQKAGRWVYIFAAFFLQSTSPEVIRAEQTQSARPSGRYFLSGDGILELSNSNNLKSIKIRYRAPDGSHFPQAWQQINRIFGIEATSDERVSLRLISFLDYFEDRFQGPIKILSGYRSQAYNANLRKRGALAARTSLHTEGMAADLRVGKRLAAQAYEILKNLNCCGVGYYHGSSLHVDTGPARYWDETSSGVRTNVSDHNKRIMVRTDKDIYLPGETIRLRLARITDYPFGVVSGFAVFQNENAENVRQQFSLNGNQDSCLTVRDPRDKTMRWTIPEGFQTDDKVQVQLRFCNKPFPEMPEHIVSNPIVVP